jgi:hypothetical protein
MQADKRGAQRVRHIIEKGALRFCTRVDTEQ